jgi:hypothetical protein
VVLQVPVVCQLVTLTKVSQFVLSLRLDDMMYMYLQTV